MLYIWPSIKYSERNRQTFNSWCVLECSILLFVWSAPWKCLTNNPGFINTGQNEMRQRGYMESENGSGLESEIFKRMLKYRWSNRIEKSTFPFSWAYGKSSGCLLSASKAFYKPSSTILPGVVHWVCVLHVWSNELVLAGGKGNWLKRLKALNLDSSNLPVGEGDRTC